MVGFLYRVEVSSELVKIKNYLTGLSGVVYPFNIMGDETDV